MLLPFFGGLASVLVRDMWIDALLGFGLGGVGGLYVLSRTDEDGPGGFLAMTLRRSGSWSFGIRMMGGTMTFSFSESLLSQSAYLCCQGTLSRAHVTCHVASVDDGDGGLVTPSPLASPPIELFSAFDRPAGRTALAVDRTVASKTLVGIVSDGPGLEGVPNLLSSVSYGVFRLTWREAISVVELLARAKTSSLQLSCTIRDNIWRGVCNTCTTH